MALQERKNNKSRLHRVSCNASGVLLVFCLFTSYNDIRAQAAQGITEVGPSLLSQAEGGESSLPDVRVVTASAVGEQTPNTLDYDTAMKEARQQALLRRQALKQVLGREQSTPDAKAGTAPVLEERPATVEKSKESRSQQNDVSPPSARGIAPLAETAPLQPSHESSLAAPEVHQYIENEQSLLDTFDTGRGAEPDLSGASSLRPDFLDPVTLEEAVSMALRNSPEYKAFEARRKGALWDNAGAYSQLLPSIEFTYAEGAEKSAPGSYNDTTGSRVSVTRHHRRDRSLYMRQPLVDLSVVADILRTKSAFDVADMEKIDAQSLTAHEAVTAFLKLLEAKKTVEMFDEYIDLLSDLSSRMNVRLEEGGATLADTNRIRSRINVAKAARLEALGQYGINIAEFKRLTNVVPSKFVMPSKLVPPVPPSADAALSVAWKANPAYLAALKKIDIAEGDRNKAFAGALPKLSVEYSDSYVYNAGGAGHGDPIDGVYPNQRDKRIMLVGRWSLTGGTAITSGMSGLQKMDEMRFKSQDVRTRISQGIYTAYDAMNATQKRIELLRDTYKTDKQIVSDLEAQFMQGERSLFELLDSQDRFHSTKVELMHAIFQEALTAYQVRSQMGEVVKAVLGQGTTRNGQ